MRTPDEIVRDVYRHRIREAALLELRERGRDGLRPGRVARRARLPVDVVVDLVPDLEAAIADEVEQLVTVSPQSARLAVTIAA